jgi:beta-galactosidase
MIRFAAGFRRSQRVVKTEQAEGVVPGADAPFRFHQHPGQSHQPPRQTVLVVAGWILRIPQAGSSENRLAGRNEDASVPGNMRGFHSICVPAVLLSFGCTANAQELYVGANYHPHDSKVADWKRDIPLMKAAGFKVVRMGHLAWDSYEPSDGRFEFEWFDQVMDLMGQAGIKVILDLAVRPAPIWLHYKYPSISITDSSGNRLYPNHRYMEDIGDPAYQEYAFRFAEALVRRYAPHPALLAFGIDNEPGDGPISYSETVRHRFVSWLQRKYPTVDTLNQAWAGQRWSRRIGRFDEVGLPLSGSISGPPERMLDFRRFVSDEVNQFLSRLIETVNVNAPGVLTTTNMWYYSPLKYFDYSALAYTGKLTRGGCGFYPGNSLVENGGIKQALFGMARIQFENTTPFWCTEFTTMTAVPKSIRKSAYASLLFGNQMICGWTWQSMPAGEEQYLEGMVDWDGVPNRKYDEYKQIAAEFKKIERYGFPYKVQAEVGLAFSFPSQIVSAAYPELHDDQLQNSFNLFFERNIDTRVVEISRSELKYKLLIVPGVAVMDETTAARIRDYVNKGGTVIMTAGSALVDVNSQVFATTLPGRLSDVFGIRIAGYEEPTVLNEISRESHSGKEIRVVCNDRSTVVESQRFDVIEAKGADVLGRIVSLDKDYPVVTSHRYGKGRAIYAGLPVRSEVLDPILEQLIDELSIKKGPATPSNVIARNIDAKHILYLNLGKESKVVELKGGFRSLLWDKDYADKFTIGPFEPEFVELK